jgi:hypothetical protein
MDVAYLSALSALAGSVIGGLTSGVTTWLNQRAQARAGQIAYDLSRRADLFRDFIIAASKTYGEAITSSDPQVQELINLYAMTSRMRVLSRPRTVACADRLIRATVDAYYAPNKTIQDLHELIKSGDGIDPLKEFSEAAREELRTLSPV